MQVPAFASNIEHHSGYAVGKGGELEGEGKDGRVWVGEHLKDRGKGGELEGEGKPMAGFGLVST